MSIADFFFGRKQNSTNSRRSVKLNRNAVRTRTLFMEPLETRDLLSVTTGLISATDYDALREQYPDFNLPENQSTLNVMVVDLDEGATALKLSDLKSAISTAGTTKKPDLILVKTSASANSVTYTSNADEITISINSSLFGSVTIIGWGEENFTLDANQKSRVMTVSNVVNLGGLTIIGGNSNSSILENQYGGGIFNSEGTLTVTNCTISGNTAAGGGGIYNGSNSTLTITRSTISGNTASASGGGILSYKYGALGTLNVINCMISGNIACTGGGIASIGTTTIINSTISRNRASGSSSLGLSSIGGGILSGGTFTIINSTISRNSAASFFGGGIYNDHGNLTVTNCTISRNSAYYDGGGIYNASGTLTVTNSTISGNSASSYGGGIYNDSGSLIVAICTISGNSASQGGGIYNTSDSFTVTNSIISKNYSSNVYGSLSPNSSNNLIGYNPGFVCSPQFYSDGKLANAETMDLHLRSDSIAIDKGDNTVVTDIETDIDGNIRIYGETVDIGAYEYQGDRNDEPFYSTVVNTLNDSFDLTDNEWSLREAIYYAQEYVTITFADNLEGTIVLALGKLVIEVPLAIDGDNRITIDADQKSRVFNVSAGTVKSPVVLNGLTIQNGYVSGFDGGGIYNDKNSTLTITNCKILGNISSRNNLGGCGGGIYNHHEGILTVINSIISGNGSTVAGGGIYNNSGTLIVTNSTISGNATSSSGGGIVNYSYNGDYSYNGTATLTVINSTISENRASSGGGICNSGYNSTLTVTNSTIAGNSASSDGGGISSFGITLTVTNSTIARNTASLGGGISNSGTTLKITNSTIAGNTASSGGGIYNHDSYATTIYNSIIACNSATIDKDIYNTVGFIDSYNSLSSFTSWDDGNVHLVYDESLPLFIDAENDDYHLIADSQAINKGNNSYAVDSLSHPLSTDLAGIPRILEGTVDLGAYEYDSRTVLFVPAFKVTANETTVIVNITPVENAVAYRIEYSLNDDFTASTTIDAQEGENVLNDLQLMQTYYVRVKSIGNVSFADSDYSNAQTFINFPALTGLSLSTNSPEVGMTITTTLTPSDVPATYQWYSGTTLIEGATDSSYTVLAKQLGQTITCVATGVNSETVSATTADTVRYSTPEGYNDNDYQKMVAFLEQTDSDGVKNGTKLNANYEPTEPSSWTGVNWDTIDGEERIVSISISCKWLVGSADFSNMTSLITLYCSSNQLASNQLTSLNVSSCTALTKLVCDSNQLTSLDVFGCTALTDLNCSFNLLTSLDVSNIRSLVTLYCYSNQLSSLDLSGCVALRYLYCYSNQFTFLNVSDCTELISIYCTGNQLSKLDVSKCTVLESLACSDNQMTTINLFNNKKLTLLGVGDSYLSKVCISDESIAKLKIHFYQSAYLVTNSQGSSTIEDSSFSTANFYQPTELPFTATSTTTGKVIAFDTAFPLSCITLSTETPEVDTIITTTIDPPDATVDYQWYCGDAIIDGATESSFTVTTDQIGYSITCVVTGKDDYIGTVSATTEVVPAMPLSTPSDFILLTENSIVQLSWSAVNNSMNYTAEYKCGDSDWSILTTTTETTASFIGLPGSEYSFRVKANGIGIYADSEYSSVETITIADTLDAHNDFVKTTLNSPVVIDYRENDDATDWSVVTVQFGEASHGEYVVNEDGTVSYTPENGFFGTDTIGYALFSPSGKASVGSISISVGLPIATSVQKTSSSHSPSSEMAPSVDSLTDWENCCVELWAQGVNELNSGETTVTLEYNPAVYEAPYFSACPEGVALAASEGVVLPNGNVEIQLTVHVSEPLESQTDNLFLGTVVLAPSFEEDAGVEDVLTPEPICVLDGSELTTTVEAMPYDLVRNGAVDVNDFVAFATVFGTNLATMSPDNPLYAQAVKADFNKDGIVNVDDFVMFAIKFGVTKKRVEIPAAQASAAALPVRSEELGVRSSASVIYDNSEDAPVSDVSLLLPQNEVESSMTLLEAYSAALLDLYDNQESFDQTEPSAVLAESRTESPVASYSDGSSQNTPFDAVDAVLEEDLLAIDWE